MAEQKKYSEGKKTSKKKKKRVVNCSARTRGGAPYIYKNDKLKDGGKSVSCRRTKICVAKIEIKRMQQSEKNS